MFVLCLKKNWELRSLPTTTTRIFLKPSGTRYLMLIWKCRMSTGVSNSSRDFEKERMNNKTKLPIGKKGSKEIILHYRWPHSLEGTPINCTVRLPYLSVRKD